MLRVAYRVSEKQHSRHPERAVNGCARRAWKSPAMEWSLEFWGESQGCAAVYALEAAHAIRNSIPHRKFTSKLSGSTVRAYQTDVALIRPPIRASTSVPQTIRPGR